MNLREGQADDRPAVAAFLAQRGATRVARRNQLVDPLEHPALLAEDQRGGRLLGVLTYVVDRDRAQCEVLTLHAVQQWRGVGTALLQLVEQAAQQGCGRLWLVTTNDNVDALRFYQRRGFRLAALRRGAVDDGRARLKPEIPTVGDYGIPLRDELELDKPL
ncbi:MAG TPA: GNAT family N-acetyltransferase [Actinomycetota bacterium]|jgi:ribosomal protein S18 acetylase RimI-like enzyme